MEVETFVVVLCGECVGRVWKCHCLLQRCGLELTKFVVVGAGSVKDSCSYIGWKFRSLLGGK